MSKNILIVSDAAPPQINGVCRTLDNTARVLKNRGHNITFITHQNYKSKALLGYSEIVMALPPYHMIQKIYGYDAIHIATEGFLGIAARQTALKLGLPITTAYHTNFPMYLKRFVGLPERLTYQYLKWFHSKSQAVMTPTTTMVNLLNNKGFKNVVLWGRGVDTNLFKSRKVCDIDVGPRPYFLNVGRVSPEKNLDAFLELDLPGTKIIIGDGPAMGNLRRKFPNTVFLGAKSGMDLAEWYNRCDVFVFPSKTDTYGLVVAEAISSGLPVAAYPVSGPIDIVKDSETGFLSNDLQDSALKSLELKNVARDFSWEAATDQFFQNLCFL
jgi:glycosyltransferase involved in cell wall biosynthesis